jgi:membrane-bound metal-dependent hydrolase YbcI (DUF457 family)
MFRDSTFIRSMTAHWLIKFTKISFLFFSIKTNPTSSNTTNQAALLDGVINDVITESHGIIEDLDEESVRFHVNQL